MHNNKAICRPGSLQDGPQDGVLMKTNCIRTDFIENPKQGEALYTQRDKSEANITASGEIGILSIRDKDSGVMLTVALEDAMEVIAAALDAAKEVGSCSKKTSDNANTVESVSDS